MKKIQFHNLISLAQQETAPAVDVADSVLATLSGMAQQVAAEPYRAYLWTGIVSAAVAACIAIAATVTLQTDSVSEMMSYISWVTQ